MDSLSTSKKLKQNYNLTDSQAETVLSATKLIIDSNAWLYAFQLEKILNALAHELSDYALSCALAEQEKRNKFYWEE